MRSSSRCTSARSSRRLILLTLSCICNFPDACTAAKGGAFGDDDVGVADVGLVLLRSSSLCRRPATMMSSNASLIFCSSSFVPLKRSGTSRFARRSFRSCA
eukprot:4688977-Amphidinium_carterae.1